jgi:hypothetical protein
MHHSKKSIWPNIFDNFPKKTTCISKNRDSKFKMLLFTTIRQLTKSDGRQKNKCHFHRTTRFAAISIILALLMIGISPAWAAQVTLSWEDDFTPDFYQVYQRIEGQEYDYSLASWSGNESSCTIDDLSEGVRYYFFVRASIGGENEDSNEIEYLSTTPNRGPNAIAGDSRTITPQTSVTLDGSGSFDPDGDYLTFLWTQTAGPEVQISDTNAVEPFFIAPQGTTSMITLTFQLTVSDPDGLSSSDTCQVFIEAVVPPNTRPIAEAGSNQTVAPQSTVALNGSGSSDPDGDNLHMPGYKPMDRRCN